MSILLLGTLALFGCKDETPPEGELLVSARIGPEGGMLEGEGVRLVVPPGAFTTEQDLQLRTSTENLSAADYRQSGPAMALYPAGLGLALPAELTFNSGPSEPAVLFQQDGLTVAGNGLTTYVNELGPIAVAGAGTPVVTLGEPLLSTTPEQVGAVIHDTAAMRINAQDVSRVQMVMTAYDFAGAYTRPLNGMSSGDCAFRLENVTGASLSGGCSEAATTASLTVNGGAVGFDAVPFLVGKVDTPVTVGVIVGGEEISHFVGFFGFDTSACFEETCSGRGVCNPDVEGGACVCDDGFAPGPDLTCVCVPQCEGRECGDDGCGMECGFCADGEGCSESAQCVPFDDSTTGESTDGTVGTGETEATDDSGSTGGGSSGSTGDTGSSSESTAGSDSGSTTGGM